MISYSIGEARVQIKRAGSPVSGTIDHTVAFVIEITQAFNKPFGGARFQQWPADATGAGGGTDIANAGFQGHASPSTIRLAGGHARVKRERRPMLSVLSRWVKHAWSCTPPSKEARGCHRLVCLGMEQLSQ